jgi:nitrite reductase/ring-hydroxylating ferredoxin subunit
VVFGALQDARNGALAVVVVVASLGVAGFHVAAARRSAHEDLSSAKPSPAPSWIDVGPADCVPEGGSIVVRPPGGEAVAIFNDGGALSAVSHACAHQNGPLGEGRILDGCVVCPWHGFQYRLVDGCAPAPFTEKIATYRLSAGNGRLLLDPQANPPGTRVEPVRVATRP